ncbi:MAG TPA: tetratricopeptide repeat protein, partial [Myxococcota bacterium]
RITVQLIDAKTDSHLWAETYDRELTATNIFSIQGNVARAVADALRATLSPRELEQLARVPTESLDAYEAYLLAKQRMERRTSDALAQAADGFRRAIGLDARFALAYVGLAEIYVLQLEYSGQSVGDVLPKATAAIDRALDLDPDLGEAYNALGAIRYALLDFEGAERAYRRALELQPNYALTYHWYAFLLRDHLARCDEALRLHQKALELDPLSPIFIVNLGMDLSCLGEFDEALGRFERTIQMDPEFALGYWAIGWHHATVLGQLDEAVRWYRKGISLDQGNDQAAVALGALYLHLGAIEQSKRWIQRSIEIKPDSPFANLRMSEIALGDGDEAGALEHARRALAAEPDWSLALARLRDLELRAGNPERARALYERANPELLDASDPKVERRNYKQAIDLAFVLLEMGERERAQRLLERARRQIQQVPRLGLPWGFGIADVRIYAMQGDVQRALASLRQAVDEGWRTDWRYELALDPSLASLHDEPEFKAIVAELEADMAEQRARVEEMERRGELIFPTE